jgi:hypothetical protein
LLSQQLPNLFPLPAEDRPLDPSYEPFDHAMFSNSARPLDGIEHFGGVWMDYNDHCQRVGYIHMNVAALETSLRFFLLKANNENFTAPKSGETETPLTHMTNFASLSWLITEYNAKLNGEERPSFALDESSVRVRDALAHGRLTAPAKEFPLTLWKFGRVKSGRVPIEYNQVLAIEWLDETWKKIHRQKELVDECCKQRGYPIN